MISPDSSEGDERGYLPPPQLQETLCGDLERSEIWLWRQLRMRRGIAPSAHSILATITRAAWEPPCSPGRARVRSHVATSENHAALPRSPRPMRPRDTAPAQ